MPQPDIRLREGALALLSSRVPDTETKARYMIINSAFQELLTVVWDQIPDGPGKALFVRALDRARMQANSTITHEGA